MQICKECNSEFMGRTDKQFCSDQCRYIFNNRKKRNSEKLILDVNKALRRNRSILKKFSPIGKTTIRKEILLLSGFDFKYFTHIYSSQKGLKYNFCYEYGYSLLPDEKVLIVNHQPYMD